MKTVIINAAVRAVRTAAQAFLAVYGAGIIGADRLVDFIDSGLLEAAAVAAVIALVTFVWNLVEGATGDPLPKG